MRTMPVDTFMQMGAMAARTGAAATASRPAVPAPPPGMGGGDVYPPEDIRQAVDHVNDHIRTVRRDLRFTVDQASGRSVVKVIDTETGELIRQIPPDEMLALSRIIGEMMGREGVLLTDKV